MVIAIPQLLYKVTARRIVDGFSMRVSAFREDFLCEHDGTHGAWPSGIEGQVRDRLDQLLLLDPVLYCVLEMEAQLVCPIERDEGGHGNQAAITLRQFFALPHVVEQHSIGQFDQFGCEITDQLLCS